LTPGLHNAAVCNIAVFHVYTTPFFLRHFKVFIKTYKEHLSLAEGRQAFHDHESKEKSGAKLLQPVPAPTNYNTGC